MEEMSEVLSYSFKLLVPVPFVRCGRPALHYKPTGPNQETIEVQYDSTKYRLIRRRYLCSDVQWNNLSGNVMCHVRKIVHFDPTPLATPGVMVILLSHPTLGSVLSDILRRISISPLRIPLPASTMMQPQDSELGFEDIARRKALTKRVLWKLDTHVLPPLAFVRVAKNTRYIYSFSAELHFLIAVAS